MATGMLFLYAPILIRIFMSNASTTARFLSLALLFLSVAPFASLYALLFSPNANGIFLVSTSFGGMTRTTTMTADSKSIGTLSNVLQNPNATMEELWAALLLEAGFQSTGSSSHYFSTGAISHHWAIVIPWGISLLLGIVVPAFLSIMSFAYGGRIRRGEDQFGRLRKSRRKESIVKLFRKVRKTLAKDDFDLDNVDDEGIPRLSKLPPHRCRRGRIEAKSSTRAASGSCAICLTPYAVGDDVVWSSNPSCCHIFHENCIQAWLLRERHEQRCPCCRQDFVEGS